MGKSLFITGTDTDIGKTYVTGLIVKKLRTSGYNAGYYKAALSGAELSESGEISSWRCVFVHAMAKIPIAAKESVSYIYREAVSPHLAAKINNQPIEMEKIIKDYTAAKEKYDYLTMEGSGGIICPLRWDDNEKLILDEMVNILGLSVLIVASAGLGTINSTVLTVEHLHAKNIPIKGLIFNNYHRGNIMEEDNLYMVEKMTGIKVITAIPSGTTELDININDLIALYQ